MGGGKNSFLSNPSKAVTGDWRNQVFGTSDLADSAQAAAEEQQRIAGQQQKDAVDYAKNYSSQMQSLADMSPQQLAQHGQALQAASTNLQQRQKLLNSVDPALMEASHQVLNLLQGGPSASTPARQAQRQQMINSLRSQYGPGAENSSIGQRMLQQFDMGTLGARNQDLASLMGVGQYGMQLQNNVGQGIDQLMGAQGHQMQALTSGANSVLGAMMGTNQNVLNAAGANQVANQINYGAQKGFWDNWSQSSMRFGESFGGMGMGKAMGGVGGGGGTPDMPVDGSAGGYGSFGGTGSIGNGPAYNRMRAQP